VCIDGFMMSTPYPTSKCDDTSDPPGCETVWTGVYQKGWDFQGTAAMGGSTTVTVEFDQYRTSCRVAVGSTQSCNACSLLSCGETFGAIGEGGIPDRISYDCTNLENGAATSFGECASLGEIFYPFVLPIDDGAPAAAANGTSAPPLSDAELDELTASMQVEDAEGYGDQASVPSTTNTVLGSSGNGNALAKRTVPAVSMILGFFGVLLS